MTRKRYFFSYRNGQFDEIQISCDLKEDLLTSEDKAYFFDYIDAVNQTKYPSATKRSIEFPQKKELFLGAIRWDKAYALILLDHLMVISDEGQFIERIEFPKELGFSNIFEFFPPEVKLQREKNRVYFYDENEGCLRIFVVLPGADSPNKVGAYQ
jgi:hypothetical protein